MRTPFCRLETMARRLMHGATAPRPPPSARSHAAETDVAIRERRRAVAMVTRSFETTRPLVPSEIRENQTRLLELLLRALAADEDDVRPVGRKTAADVTADRSCPHHADA